MTPEKSRVSGDTEAKLRFVRDTLSQFYKIEDMAMLSTAMLHSIIPTDRVALAVIEGNTLRSVGDIGKRMIMDLSLDQKSINARTVKTRRTQLVNDTRKDQDYFPGDGGDSYTMLSELCVPIIHGGDVLGTINFESRKPGRFTEGDAEVAEIFTKEVAEAVHRVMSHESPGGGLQTCYTARTRSSLDRYHDLLKVVQGGESVANKILNRAAIPWKPGKEMIDELVAKGYLAREQVSASRHAYRITEEGVKVLKTYEGILENLSR